MSTPKRTLAVVGGLYSLREVYNLLILHDSPCLVVNIGDVQGSIQDAHITEEQFLSVPGIAETVWRYEYTTDEWIPVFTYTGSPEKLLACIDYEEGVGTRETWITPKGFPRKQHFGLDRSMRASAP